MIEFFFDCSSPWTYLAFHNLRPVARAPGAFGSPTMFVDGDGMYFGNDRLELVHDAVIRRQSARQSSARRLPPRSKAASPRTSGRHACRGRRW